MSHYFSPRRLVHFLLGGTAIWMGTAFASPLCSCELDLPPKLASAPDALGVPEHSSQPSILPAASLAGDEATFWDNGPVQDDWYSEDSDHCEHDSSVAATGGADGLVDKPALSVYRNLESGDEHSECDYGEVYGTRDSDVVQQVASEAEVASESAKSYGSDWEDYYYGDDYENAGQATEDQATVAVKPMVDEVCAEEAWVEEYEYDYGTDICDDSKENAEEKLDLCAWQPSDLLKDADIGLIQSLERLSDSAGTLRRAQLNEYIEGLGFEAIDFVYRYEDATGMDVLSLAAERSKIAALLASYRLVQQDTIGMDEAVELLENSLSELSPGWIEAVGSMTAPSEPTVSRSHPVVDAIVAAANRSAASLDALASAISSRLANVPWDELSGRLREIRSAFRPLGSDDGLTY